MYLSVCIPQEFYVADALDDRAFVLDELHKAYHHYIKVRYAPQNISRGWVWKKTAVLILLRHTPSCWGGHFCV